MWNIIGPCWVMGALIAVVLMMFYLLEDRYVDFEIENVLNHIDEFFKFICAPQIVIYKFVKDKLRLSGIIICEIFVSLFFVAFNIVILVFSLFTKLLQFLWFLFVKIFGKKEEEEEIE